ncbi:MFS transporter [Capsulimonas corticalis]|uniref:MFS transporter n=1 Tax=Capsulimonas corticalis TaxID=2219043 RepID=A0A402CQ26_9BACT|nr:MFS transporter [Capsulimonas corticalis]BDI32896.1 MFS transporter [Capsulimonas corticalis]
MSATLENQKTTAEAPPLSLRAIIAYSLANIGAGAFYAFNNYILPLWLGDYTHNAMLKGILAETHSFEGAILQPLIGSASDRLRTRWGRRRPFMILFAPLSALLLLLTPVAATLPVALRLGGIVACIFFSTLIFNFFIDPYQSLLADITPAKQRGRVSGIWYLIGALGQVVILLLPLAIVYRFVLTGVLMIVLTAVTCMTTRETATTDLDLHGEAAIHRLSYWGEMAAAVKGLKTLRQARLYLIMYFCYGAGTSAVVPQLTTFIKDITHCSNDSALQMVLILMVATAIGGVPCGWFTDRIGPKAMTTVGIAMIGLSAINGLWVNNLASVAIVLIFAGLGTAAQNASSYALLTRLIPCEEIGFFTGLQTTALSIVGPASVLITGYLINHYGERVIFGVCFVCILVALAFINRLQPENAAAEIEQHARNNGKTIGAAANN